MNTNRIDSAAAVTRQLVRLRKFAREKFVLADVGASGGISEYWRQFEPDLSAFGFDPLVRECERLNELERNSAVRYFDYFVDWGDYELLYPKSIQNDPVLGWSNQPFARTSATRMQRALARPAAQHFNYGNPDLVFAKRRTSLDAFFREHPGVAVDFLKIDTDGFDYEVLCGAQQLLEEHQILGLQVEVQFHGVSHPHANLFANIDRFLRERGFSLFDLEVYRYTRDCLPGHFVYQLPAQTEEGQVVFGDALYLRDVAAPDYERRWNCALPESKLLKLVCLFEIFGLPDCAAELLGLKRDSLAGSIDVPVLLDLLAGRLHPRIASYNEVNARFERNPADFYPRTAPRILHRMLPGPVRRMLSALRRRLRP